MAVVTRLSDLSPVLVPEGPGRLDSVDARDLGILTIGDQVLVEFQPRQAEDEPADPVGLAGRVRAVRKSGIGDGEVTSFELVSRDGTRYRVHSNGAVDRVEDERTVIRIGRSAQVSVVREIVPDGGWA